MSNTLKSQIAHKLKTVSKGAWKKARKTEAKARGGGGLPPNLKNVVAVCQNYKMALTQNGDPYFQLKCVIKDPEELMGKIANFMWFINENEYASVEDNLVALANDLQLLGKEMPEDVEEIVTVLAELCEAGVHLLFNTGGPKKSGKAPSLFIQGLAEDWPDEQQDDWGEIEGKSTGNKNQPAKKGGKPKDEEAEEQEEENTDETPEDETSDDSGDGGDDNSEETTEEETPWEPAKGDNYFYTPKGGKKTKVEVIAVDKKKKTFDLKGGKPPRTFKAVKWWKDKEETEASVEGE